MKNPSLLFAQPQGHLHQGLQRSATDMVLHTLGIGLSGLGRDANRVQELQNDLMPGTRPISQFSAFFSQEDRSIRLGINETVVLQTLNRRVDRRSAHAKMRCQINQTRLTINLNQIGTTQRGDLRPAGQ
jgi:hypothetical protein